MKRMLASTIVLVLILLFLPSAEFVSARTMFDLHREGLEQEGDFFEYKLSGRSYESQRWDGKIRMEAGGTEIITVEGESIECIVVTGRGFGNVAIDPVAEGKWKMTGTTYFDSTTGEVRREVLKKNYIFEDGYQFSETRLETEETYLERSTDPVFDSLPEVGDSWSETVLVTHNYTVYYEDLGEDQDSYIGTSTIDFRYLRDETIATDIGTFDCMVIKSFYYTGFDDDDEDYSIDHIDKNRGLYVRSEFYDNGVDPLTIELTAYKIGDEEAGESAFDTTGGSRSSWIDIDWPWAIAFFVGVAIGVVVLVIHFNKLKKKKAAEAQPGQKKGVHDDQQGQPRAPY